MDLDRASAASRLQKAAVADLQPKMAESLTGSVRLVSVESAVIGSR